MKLDATKIDWSQLDKIEDPEQKKFFEGIKRGMNSGQDFNSTELLNSIVSVVGKGDKETHNKLTRMNESLKAATDILNNIKF